jgi:integrase
MSVTQRLADAIIEGLADKYRIELRDEEVEEQLTVQPPVPLEENDIEASTLPVVNLASIPIHSWGQLKVSKLSTFADMRWDWRQEGSPIYKDATFHNWDVNLDTDLPLLIDEHAPLVTLMRALLFYWTPQNAVFVNVRSFNSTAGAGDVLVILGRFLASHGVYVDKHCVGEFKIVNELTPEMFRAYHDKLVSVGEKTWFVRHVRHWRQLSQAGLLPPEFQLGYEVFSKAAVAKAYKEFDEAKTPYQPISLETLSVMVSHCFTIIEDYADDILFAYELFWPVMHGASKKADPDFDWHTALLKLEQHETTLWSMEQFIDPDQHMPWRAAMKLRQEIMRHPGWTTSSFHRPPTALYRTPLETVKNIALGLGLDPKGSNRAIHYDVVKVRAAIMNMATMLRNACAIIILLVTGMRRSELANLEAGSHRQAPDEPGGYRLRFLVFKFSDGSQGDEQDIPISRIAYEALCCMERLSAHARRVGGNNFLFASATTMFGKPISLGAVNGFLAKWCEELGLNEMVHPHQFRKTLAMFLIYQDTGNLPLIKRLFSHKSLKMSLVYITKLPGMAQEVKLALLEQNRELMSELLEAAVTGVIGGSAGLRIKEHVRSGNYAAMLNDDGWETLEQYVDSLLDEGVTLLHRASLGVICTKTLSVDQNAPCDPPYAPRIKRLRPNVQNCDPLECKWAVFTETSVSKLQNEIRAHRKWLNHPYASADQKSFSEKTIASCLAKLRELGFSEDGERLPIGLAERIA